MIFIILGIIIGVAVVLGPLDFLRPTVDSILDAFLVYGHNFTEFLFEISGADLSSDGSRITIAVVSALLPGLLCLVLVMSAKLALKTRKVLSSLAVIAALASFFFIPVQQALIVLVVTVVLSVFSSLVTGVGLVLPITALSSALATANLISLNEGTNAEVQTSAQDLYSILETPSLSVWIALLSIFTVVPFILALLTLLNE